MCQSSFSGVLRLARLRFLTARPSWGVDLGRHARSETPRHLDRRDEQVSPDEVERTDI